MTDTPMSPERAAEQDRRNRYEKYWGIEEIEPGEGYGDSQLNFGFECYELGWQASREQALEEAAKICEGLVDECSKARETRPNCHNLDAQKIRELKESQ